MIFKCRLGLQTLLPPVLSPPFSNEAVIEQERASPGSTTPPDPLAITPAQLDPRSPDLPCWTPDAVGMPSSKLYAEHT